MIQIPETKLIETKLLTVDNKNPNFMSKEVYESLKTNIQKYGFLIPIITNKDFLIADGEHRWKVAIEFKLLKVPVIRIPLKEVDRRILRQVMNKLRGTHREEMDVEEYKFILKEASMEELTSLISVSEQEILNVFERSVNKDLISEVDRTHERLMTCPKCGTEFKKSQ